jgi:hypothetical protein
MKIINISLKFMVFWEFKFCSSADRCECLGGTAATLFRVEEDACKIFL